MTEEDMVQYMLTAFVTLCVAIIGFFTRRIVLDVERLKAGSQQCEVNRANFRAEVAKDYARDVNVQSSLSRIHQRLDRLPQEIIEILNARGVNGK